MRTDTESDHNNMFGSMTIKELEQAADDILNDINAAESDGSPGPADAYWMLGAYLHALRRKKRMSPDECIQYVCGKFGFDDR